jgi:GNAT superfamily N-acetyltransferase
VKRLVLLPGVAFRKAGFEDRERVRAFYVACGRSGLLEPADRVLIAEAGGQIVGAVRLCVEDGVQVLRTMRVRPDAQRRGLGRLLKHYQEFFTRPPVAPGPDGQLDDGEIADIKAYLLLL